MKKSIEVKVIGHPDELIIKAKHAAEKYGLHFMGDAQKGIIKGLGIEAHYLLQEDLLRVRILHKPFFLSWEKVEQKLKAIVVQQPQK
jgi:hypothetical protein